MQRKSRGLSESVRSSKQLADNVVQASGSTKVSFAEYMSVYIGYRSNALCQAAFYCLLPQVLVELEMVQFLCSIMESVLSGRVSASGISHSHPLPSTSRIRHCHATQNQTCEICICEPVPRLGNLKQIRSKKNKSLTARKRYMMQSDPLVRPAGGVGLQVRRSRRSSSTIHLAAALCE